MSPQLPPLLIPCFLLFPINWQPLLPPPFLPLPPCPMAQAYILEPSEKMREIGDDEGDEEEEIGWISFFPSLWPALKDSLPLSLSHIRTNLSLSSLSHAWSCLFLSSLEQSVYFQQTSGGILCRKIRTVCHHQWQAQAYTGKCYLFIRFTDAPCCIQSLWLVRKHIQHWQMGVLLNRHFPGVMLPVTLAK